MSAVPPQIKSSYAYKRQNFLDLQCIFENLEPPQLFVTFLCDDNSEDFKNLTAGTKNPWDNPVTFEFHWKRKWLKFFNDYILGHFADQIKGIKEHNWVMERQDRESPHIHLALWTEATVEELIKMKVVHTWFPKGNSSRDSLMYHLVNKHQLHSCANMK